MGSSSKKKKEKEQDFKKTKLKVGKKKVKPSNFTDTTFKSKAINVQQLLPGANAGDPVAQFKHNLSLATSRSESQRADALKFITHRLSENPPYNPVGTLELLVKLLPLMTDPSQAVRAGLHKVLKSLPRLDIAPYVDKIVLYVRAAMTSLSSDVSRDSVSVLEWLIDMFPQELFSAPGCWVKPLNCFVTVLRWSAYLNTPGSQEKGWTSAPSVNSVESSTKKDTRARQLAVLGKFLKAGLAKPSATDSSSVDVKYMENLYLAPRNPNAFSYYNVFGGPRDEENQIYLDSESRLQVFQRSMGRAVVKGIEEAKKEGGNIGREGQDIAKMLKLELASLSEAVQDDVEFSLRGALTLW